jgi:hypothetical protein
MLVATREMPPYHYDTHVGIQQIKNDWRLSEEEIRTIAEWVDAGAPMGDPADMPPPVEWPSLGSKYRLEDYFGRPPDVVITSTRTRAGGGVRTAGGGPGAADRDHGVALHRGDRDQAGVEARTVAHHANTSFRGGTTSTAPAAPAVATRTTAVPGHAPERVRDGQDRRDHSARRLPPRSGQRQRLVGHPLLSERNRGEGRQVSVGIWLHPPEHSRGSART